MTEYFRAGFGGSRSGGGRFGGTDAWGDGAVASEGVYWTPAYKDVGRRQNGWELLRERLKNVMKPEGPRLFVFNTCRQFIRTVPVQPGDEINMDDVDSKAEGHVGEETRDRLLSKGQTAVVKQI